VEPPRGRSGLTADSARARTGAGSEELSLGRSATNANHNANQIFYYDEHFMQRRMDYSPDVTGNPPIAQYSHDEKTFDGFVFPTRRLVYRHDAEGVADQSFAPITVNVYSVTIERA
jgi:hypothetical protein